MRQKRKYKNDSLNNRCKQDVIEDFDVPSQEDFDEADKEFAQAKVESFKRSCRSIRRSRGSAAGRMKRTWSMS
jgi:hypothetical protein